MIRAETNDTVVVDLDDVEEPCGGPGTCHGCMAWCDRCGDVSRACDARRCDVHRCQACHEIRLDREQDRDLCYLCYVCDPAEYPHRWPAVSVTQYALENEAAVIATGGRPWFADRVLAELDMGIERIASGDDRSWHQHPVMFARRLGLLRW